MRHVRLAKESTQFDRIALPARLTAQTQTAEALADHGGAIAIRPRARS